MQNLFMQIPAGTEWIILIIVVVVLIFGVKKIPQLARSFGKATAEYEKARIEAKKELQELRSQNNSVGREKLEEIADSLGINYTNKNDDELRAAIDAEINKEKKNA